MAQAEFYDESKRNFLVGLVGLFGIIVTSPVWGPVAQTLLVNRLLTQPISPVVPLPPEVLNPPVLPFPFDTLARQVELKDFPASSEIPKIINEFPRADARTFNILEFPLLNSDERLKIPVVLPGPLANYKNTLTSLILLAAWDEDQDISRSFGQVLKLSRDYLGKTIKLGGATVEQVDPEKILKQFREKLGISIVSPTHPFSVPYIRDDKQIIREVTADEVRKFAQAGNEMARQLTALLQRYYVPLADVTVGVIGSASQGRATLNDESDIDIRLETKDQKKYLILIQHLQRLIYEHPTEFQAMVRQSYRSAFGESVQIPNGNHVIAILRNSRRVIDVWVEDLWNIILN